AEAEEWIASNAPLLNLRFVVMAFSLMANLKPILLLKQSIDLLVRQLCVDLRKLPETVQFVVPDIRPVFLGEQVFIDPKLPTLGKNNGAVQVLAQALLVDPSAQIVRLPQHHLPNGGIKLVIRDVRLPRRPGEPGCLEDPV
ncbi:MAG: hypothetical protein ABR889_00005, partial [Acidobacteriaceae bacterium]